MASESGAASPSERLSGTDELPLKNVDNLRGSVRPWLAPHLYTHVHSTADAPTDHLDFVNKVSKGLNQASKTSAEAQAVINRNPCEWGAPAFFSLTGAQHHEPPTSLNFCLNSRFCPRESKPLSSGSMPTSLPTSSTLSV